MSDNTRRILRLIISSLVAALITTVTGLMTLLQSGIPVTRAGLWIVGLGGALQLLTHIETGLSQPPSVGTTPPEKVQR